MLEEATSKILILLSKRPILIYFIHIILSSLRGIYIYFWFCRLFVSVHCRNVITGFCRCIGNLFISMYTSLIQLLPSHFPESFWSLIEVSCKMKIKNSSAIPQQLTFAINVSPIHINTEIVSFFSVKC